MLINYDAVTLDDCLDNYRKKDLCTSLHNGHVTGFVPKGEIKNGQKQSQ